MNPPQSVHEDDSFRHNSTFVKRLSPGSWPISHRCPRQAGWRPESDPRDRPGRRGSAGNCGDVVEQRAAHRASGRRGRRERSVRAPLRPSRCCGWSPSGPATLSLRRHAAPTPTPMPSMPGTEEVVILATAGPCRPIRLRPAHDATLAKQPNVARDQAGRRPASDPRLLAICRDLVEHRVGEFALRARADEWGLRGQLGHRAHAGHGARAGVRCPRNGGSLDPHPAVLAAQPAPVARAASDRVTMPTLANQAPLAATST
jgi:hypothetical protein